VTDLFDAHESIRGGAAYLARQVGRFGSYEHALAAYNAGPGAVEKHGGIPPYDETRTYVARVMGLYAHFRDNRRVAR
jgi:soluble lytic murein transglycosylase-like protein